jgi:hypothetical protein
MDRGANGGIIGNDARVHHVHLREVDVTGIDNHELNSLKLVDAAAKIMTNKGPAIGIFRQYAYGVGPFTRLDNLRPTRITLMTVL